MADVVRIFTEISRSDIENYTMDFVDRSETFPTMLELNNAASLQPRSDCLKLRVRKLVVHEHVEMDLLLIPAEQL